MSDIVIMKSAQPKPISIKMAWFTALNTTKHNLPEWVRSAGIDGDGNVYVPAVLAGGETSVYLSASHFGEPVVIDAGDHLFFRADWMKREFPDTAKIITKIERWLRAAQKTQKGKR